MGYSRHWRVYRLIDPITLETRYIGITSMSLTRRLMHHFCEQAAGNPEKFAWISSLKARSQLPDIRLIDTVEGTRAQAEVHEREWVYRYLAQGAPLLNRAHIPGGDRALFVQFLQENEVTF